VEVTPRSGIFSASPRAHALRCEPKLMVGQEIEFLELTLATHWISETRELSRMLTGLINRITE